MGVIEISGMEFYANHGCFAEERKIGTNFKVDLWIGYDSLKAQRTDNIDDTVNYLLVYQSVKKQMSVSSNLLENVAERITSALLDEFASVDYVKVRVSKLNPPLGGKMDSVSVMVEKTRSR